jgi:methylated-DNA-[protein]-cysteine S-methyltransferase
MLYATTLASPVGELTILASDEGVRAVLWPDDDPRRVVLDDEITDDPEHPIVARAARQLIEYFSGDRKSFDVPLDLRGTDFQRACWRALSDIPYGATISYAEQAAAVGRPRAVRAVGAANGRNPVSIILPCHRVVSSSGAPTGFAGGLPAKAWLLEHEARRGREN